MSKTRIPQKKLLTRARANQLVGFMFVLPWILGFIVFSLYPIAQTIIYSVNNVTFTHNAVRLKPVGIKNFAEVLAVTPDFRLQLPGYLRLMLLIVPTILILSLLLSIFLNTKIKLRGLYRAVFFLPVILLSPPMLNNLFEMKAFTLNGLHDFFVFQFIEETFKGNIASWFMFVMDNIILCLWYSGVPILIFLSGLQKVDPNVYEAAMVDGASVWQKFWKITIATLKPFIFLNAVYIVIDISTSTLNPMTNIILDSMYRSDRGYGFASAAAWIYFALVLLFVVATYLVFGRLENDVYAKQEKKHAREEKRSRRRIKSTSAKKVNKIA